MDHVTATDKTKLYVKDWGSGWPVIVIHGWPLSADSWNDQAMAIADAGHRAIAYDRRGRSSQPWTAYDYDTLVDPSSASTLHGTRSATNCLRWRAVSRCRPASRPPWSSLRRSRPPTSAVLAAFKVPMLIIHGTADLTVPIDASSRAAAKSIKHSTLVEYDGAPHGVFATHKRRLTKDLIGLLGRRCIAWAAWAAMAARE